MSWLDVKLGFRMLVRYPGLTIVGGLALAFAIAVGAAAFEAVNQRVFPRLPLDGGDRIVGIQTWNVDEGRPEMRVAHDLIAWREQLESFDELAAFRTRDRNLIAGDGPGEPVPAAEMTASGFRVADVPPLLGRTLDDADERPGATPVAVLGYELWQTRFGGDAGIIGQTVRIGDSRHTVVGVMPEGFAFPIAHRLWTPLRLDAGDLAPVSGPAIHVFGRLAAGESLATAQAELTTVGERLAAAFPATHRPLRPRALPYVEAVAGSPEFAAVSINVFFIMLLVLVGGNVALLMFARAAARQSEIAVRGALGASRRRIVTQFFAEALVLAAIAAAAGLGAARFALLGWQRVMEAEAAGRVPFWIDGRLSPDTILYAALLALLGAAVAGVIPALKMTGGRVRAGLQRAGAAAGPRFGGVWTAVIVAQVAVTVAFPATAFFVRRSVAQIQDMDVGFAAERYASARIEIDADRWPPAGLDTRRGADASVAEPSARLVASLRELERRLESEPDVSGVTFTTALPRTYHPQRWIEVDGEAAPREAAPGYRVGTAAVAPDYFDVLGAEVLAGRGFRSERPTGASDRRTVLVNQAFVRRVLGGRSPVGRRIRFTRPPDEEPAPWLEIAGVVPDLGMVNGGVTADAGIYQPLPADAAGSVHMAVHVRGDPASFAARIRAAVVDVDPTLRVYDILPLDAVGQSLWLEFAFLFRLLVGVSAIALLLALAGIYAVMSFTVSRRTREIGVRVALGADAWRVVAAIFRRPLTQVALGVLAGGVLVAALAVGVLRGGVWPGGAALVIAYAVLMMAVCLLACIVPTRRALSVEPTVALKADGG